MRLIQSISHEVMTPLNSALPLLEDTLKHSNLNRNIKENYLDYCYSSLKLLENYLQDIKDFGLILVDQFQLKIEKILLFDYLNTVVDIINLSAQNKQLQLQLEFNLNRNFVIQTDPQRLKQILINLLTNAIKFTQQGIIKLQISAADEQDNYIQLAVSDTGIGFSEESAQKMRNFLKQANCQSFVDINSSGLCLGLLISSKIAQALIIKNMDEFNCNLTQQNLTFESEEKVGTKFTFVIKNLQQPNSPIIFNDEYQDNSISENIQDESLLSIINSPIINSPINIQYSPETQTMNKFIQNIEVIEQNEQRQIEKKCLIVDDDPFNLIALETLLKKFNFACDRVYNGEEAIQKLLQMHSNYPLASTKYSLIFMDFQMPIMGLIYCFYYNIKDGITASIEIQNLIQQKQLPKIPIIACTAFDNASDIKTCFQAGMSDFLAKPISQKSLSKVINKSYQ